MVTVIDQNTIVKVVDNLVFNTTGAGGGDLVSTNNLSDVANVATARTNLGLGTASTLNVGIGANNIVQLDGSGLLPAIDGSQLTNLPAGFADPMTTRGDLIYRDNSNSTARLPLGASNAVLLSNGTDLIWSTISSSILSNSANIALLDASQTFTNKTISSASNTLAIDADDVEDASAAHKFVTSGDLTTLANITVTQPVDLDTIEANVATNNAKVTNANHTGDVTGSTVLTIANDAVSNAKLANMTANSIKGRITGTGDPQDLTATQVRTIINVANGATANSTDATLLDRNNHTGTQLASTISNFQTTVSANTDVIANTAKVTNQTHTGDVTGSTLLTAQPAMITGKALVTAVSGDLILIVDATDGLLKRVDASDFLSGGVAQLDDLSDVTIGTPVSSTATTLRLLADANTDGTYTVIDWTPPTGGGGEANDGTNLGAGSQIFTTKSGVNLQFRSLVDTPEIVITQNANDLTFALGTNSIANSKLSQVATQTLKGRSTAGTGNVEDLTATQVRAILNVADGATANSSDATLLARTNHTGTQLSSTISDFDTAVSANADVTANTAKVTNQTHSGEVTGSTTLTIANDVVSNAKLSNMTADTIKGRRTSTGDPEDLTTTQIKSFLTYDADEISDGATTNKFVTQTELDKLGNITVTQAVDLDTIELEVADLKIDSGSIFYIGTITDRTYTIEASAKYNYNIQNLTVGVASGSFTLDLQINGVSVTGLNAVSVTSTLATSTATGANSVIIGDRVTFVATASSTPIDLELTLGFTR